MEVRCQICRGTPVDWLMLVSEVRFQRSKVAPARLDKAGRFAHRPLTQHEGFFGGNQGGDAHSTKGISKSN